MCSQSACHLLATLSHPPWEESLRRDVYMNFAGQKRIPFHGYVQPSTSNAYTGEHDSALFHFGKLPAELQLRVLAFCSASTLFQLMRVSLTLRIEASKLFWTKSDAYFLIEAQWLLEDAHPGNTYWDLDFLAYVRNIEVDYLPSFRNRICPPRLDKIVHIQYDLIEAFWNSLEKRFPRAKRVILNHKHEQKLLEGNGEPVPLSLQLLLRACPHEIDASILILEGVPKASIDANITITPPRRWEQSCYRLVVGKIWEKSESDRHRETILMPPKQFNGPVGEFRRMKYERHISYLQEWGLWPLIIEALDRHYFDGKNEPFSCPLPECDAYFAEAGAWTVHAAENHFQHPNSLLGSLPSSVRVQFAERSHAIEKKGEERREQLQKLKNAWNEENGVKQREIERAWMEQLDNDEAWATEKLTKESELWKVFVGCMTPEVAWGL